jgi:hypothetical protein
MQQTSVHYKSFFKYGIAIGLLFLIGLIYQLGFTNPSLKNNKTSADYLVNDAPQQQQHFDINATMTDNQTSSCPCSPPSFSSKNISLVEHGENMPVFVPDQLTMPEDIADKIALNKHDQTLLATVAGYGMRTELYNWIALLESAREHKYLVFCTDLKLYLHLVFAGLEDKAVLIPDDWILNDMELFRDPTLHLLDDARLSHAKTWILQRLAYHTEITNTLWLDVNQVMVHARTREYVQTLLHMRWDTQVISTQDSLDQHTVNTGLIMLRGNAKLTKRLLASTIQIQSNEPTLNQQQAFNRALDQLQLNVKSGMTVLLDIMHFPNGVNYFETNLPGSKGIKPYIIHANHKVRGGLEGMSYLGGFFLTRLIVWKR